MKPAIAAIGQQLWTGFRLNKLFRHHAVPHGQQVTLDRRRIYALPTRYGVLFAAMLFVMLLGSINYNNSLGFMLTFLLGSLALVSILYTYRNLVRLTLSAGRSMATFAGGSARFLIHLRHEDRLPRYALRLALKNSGGAVLDVAANETPSVELSLPALRRGRMALPRVTVSTTYPLGLIRAWAYVELDLQCLIYPQPGDYRPIPRSHLPKAGGHSATAAGNDDFLGFRAYRYGDSLRHVHWKALARELPLLTKHFAATESPDFWLDWATLTPLDGETRLRQLCRWVLEAHDLKRAYGLRLPGVTIAPAQGEAHRQRCLEALALYELPRQ